MKHLSQQKLLKVKTQIYKKLFSSGSTPFDQNKSYLLLIG